MDSNTRDMLCEVPRPVEPSVDSSDVEQISDDDLGSFSLLDSTNSSVSAYCLNDKDLDSDVSFWPPPSSDELDVLPVELLCCPRVQTYTHTPNRKVNMMLNFFMAVSMAMVVGLGIGHFLGYSEVTEKYELEANFPGCNDSTSGATDEPPVFMEKLEQWKGVFFKIFAENEVLQRALDKANIEIDGLSRLGLDEKTTDAHLSEYRKLRLQLITQQLENVAILKKMNLLNDVELDKLQHSYYPYFKDNIAIKERDKDLTNDEKETPVQSDASNAVLKTMNVDAVPESKTVATDAVAPMDSSPEIDLINADDLKLVTSELPSVDAEPESSSLPQGAEFADYQSKQETSSDDELEDGADGIVDEESQEDSPEQGEDNVEQPKLNVSNFYRLANNLWADVQSRLLGEMHHETLVGYRKVAQNVVKTVVSRFRKLFSRSNHQPSLSESGREDRQILQQIMDVLRNVDGQLSGVASKLSNLDKLDLFALRAGVTRDVVIESAVPVVDEEKPFASQKKKEEKKKKEREVKSDKKKGKQTKVAVVNGDNSWLFKRAQVRDKRRKEHQRSDDRARKSRHNADELKTSKKHFQKSKPSKRRHYEGSVDHANYDRFEERTVKMQEQRRHRHESGYSHN